jgi:hypothetical protein
MEELTQDQVDHFIHKGFVKIENAFSTDIADQCRAILWKASGCDPNNPESWKPVIRIGELAEEPFRKAANSTVLQKAFDTLVGHGNWLPRQTLGSFPIRFPSKEEPNDTGWHVDASFPGEDPNNYFDWRININSKGRALLMLFFFSDVTINDAPTVIIDHSHFDVARILEPAGENGLSFMKLSERLEILSAHHKSLATGEAGTVYLCHPFVVHAAQKHNGTSPKFMGQPPLFPRNEFNIHRDEAKLTPVEKAIVEGLRK